MNLFDLISSLFKYLFILIIYLFIFGIIRMIYLDISRMHMPAKAVLPTKFPYLLTLTSREKLYFDTKEFYPLDKRDIIIGRGKNCDVRIEDVSLSSKHLHIWYEDKEWFLEDMKSKNGSLLNDEVVHDRFMLDDGDLIKIGQIELQFCMNK